MKVPRTALLLCGVAALASCTPSGVTQPEGAGVPGGAVRQAGDGLVSEGIPADTSASRAGGAFGMGSGA